MVQTHTLREGSSVNKRTRDRSQIGQIFVATLEDEFDLQPKDDNNKVTVQSDLWMKWDVFVRFCRLHSVTGTVTGIISVSLLPLTSFRDLSPAFFVGLLKAVIPFVFVNIYVVTLNQLVDVGIDKINKPHLVLTSGEYTMGQGKAITSAFGIMCLAMAIMFQSPPLLYGIIIHFLVGTAYSVELPLLRWKTKPFLAALGIGLYAFNFQLAVFCHIQKYVLGRPLVHTKSFGFVLIFFILFGTVLGVFKDIPDVAGDQAFGNRTYSVRHGKKRVFSICIFILLIDYGFGVVTGALLSSLLLSKLVAVVGHCTLASLLWRRARSLNLDDDSSVESLYMFLWKGEDVNKSDAYGSVSSVVKVNESKAYNLCAGGQTIKLRFPSSTKSSKSGKNDATPAKALLTSGKNSLPLGNSSAQSQAEPVGTSQRSSSLL